MDSNEKEQMFEFLATKFDRDSILPVLDEEQQSRCKEFFKELGYHQITGSYLVGRLPDHTVGLALSYAENHSEHLKRPGALIGPAFCLDQYYPDAASVWVLDAAQHDLVG